MAVDNPNGNDRVSGKGDSPQSGNAASKKADAVVIPFIDNEVGSTKGGGRFIVRTPQSFCCNCGAQSDLVTVPTRFLKVVFSFTRYDKDIGFALALPYCKICSLNVGKFPMNTAIKWAARLAALVACISFTGFLLNTLAAEYSIPMAARLGVLIMVIIFAIWIMHRLSMPKPPQTSKYFPVKIKEYSKIPHSKRDEVGNPIAVLAAGITHLVTNIVKRHFPRDPHQIVRLSFKVSNPKYAAAFQKMNADFLRKGFIRLI